MRRESGDGRRERNLTFLLTFNFSLLTFNFLAYQINNFMSIPAVMNDLLPGTSFCNVLVTLYRADGPSSNGYFVRLNNLNAKPAVNANWLSFNRRSFL